MTHEQQIEAVAEAIRSATTRTTPFYDSANKILTRKIKQTISVATSVKAAQAAIAAMQVREMTVEEVAEILLNHRGDLVDSRKAASVELAQALAKLGAIRIVEK